MSDLEKDYHSYEQWLWNGVCIDGEEKKNHHPSHGGEKTSACVNGNTLSARNIQIALHCPFDITYLSNLLNLLGYSSFLEQLL